MARYVITIQQVVDVEANDRELALKIVRNNPPHKDMFGAGPNGAYGLKAHKSVKIISCRKKDYINNARKHPTKAGG